MTTGIRPPSNPDPKALRLWGQELVRRLQQGLDSDDAENALQEIVNEVGTITNFGSLTPTQKASFGLSQAVADSLALGSDVLAEIQQFVTTPGQAAVAAYLRAHQNEASVRVEQTTRETETLSLTTQVTTLTADLADTDAAVIAEQTARANGDSALASDISTVQTTVAGHTTSITEHQASIDGIEAEWGVTINAQGQVVGLIRLDADQSESTFTVVVDKFQVAKIDGTGIKPIFQVGSVGGEDQVVLAANMLVDGYIVAQHIAAGTITGNEIAANTITASELDVGSVNADTIAAGAVTTNKLAANAVTANKLDVNSLSAINADLGTVTAGKMQSADGNFVINLDTKVIQIET